MMMNDEWKVEEEGVVGCGKARAWWKWVRLSRKVVEGVVERLPHETAKLAGTLTPLSNRTWPKRDQRTLLPGVMEECCWRPL